MFKKFFAFAILAFSVTSTESLCDESSSIPNFSVTSTSRARIYDADIPIILPCSNGDFELSFTAQSNSALFIAFADAKGLYGPNNIIEAFIDENRRNYSIKEGIVSNIMTQPLYTTNSAVSRNYIVRYASGTITILVNNAVVATANTNGYEIDRLYLAPYVNRANFSRISLVCKSFVACPIPPPTSTVSPTPSPTPTPQVYLYDFENGSGIRDLIIEYCPRNAVVTNGALEMRIDATCGTDLIYNRKIVTGKYETKLKVAKGPGVVTAIDFYGASKDEINLEIAGSSPFNIYTMYFAKGVGIDKSPTVVVSDVDLSLDYHIYAVEILTDAINWYLDGNIVRTLQKTDPNTFPALAGDKVVFGVWSTSRFGNAIGQPNYTAGPKVAYMKWIKFTHYT
ncbi:putative glycosidase CRR1 [Smittium mucronatum]|uniref:Putative glycosidase CRR1 n=1 Tax=Smittium mucronatum TaxID=133383 RepID=A0A1R0GX08_9FUNG|nr:putative glycosidase CRR1 [Smittium mucronatum]